MTLKYHMGCGNVAIPLMQVQAIDYAMPVICAKLEVVKYIMFATNQGHPRHKAAPACFFTGSPSLHMATC
jgi:hypothetical protein